MYLVSIADSNIDFLADTYVCKVCSMCAFKCIDICMLIKFVMLIIL